MPFHAAAAVHFISEAAERDDEFLTDSNLNDEDGGGGIDSPPKGSRRGSKDTIFGSGTDTESARDSEININEKKTVGRGMLGVGHGFWFWFFFFLACFPRTRV